ncbi:arginase family protein [Luteibacter aegosomaticola]|uniref:arginase family protein n=1 Tax=Luteibacter aegosomaticola TaxID=2911538 RepID=UPI001FFBFCC2|nr:arginase family protein [Luteibacter aegosomaticola]UPG89734.1 arginase family protein [Luteibacter aegosomaticola]
MTLDALGAAAPSEPTEPTPRLIVQARGLMIEAQGELHVLIVDTTSGRRARIGRGAYQLLCRFAEPTTLEAGTTGDADGRWARGVRALLERGLLVDAANPPVHAVAPRRAVPLRFCHAPAAAPGDEPDITVLGVPYDLGGTGNHRDAPSLIRTKSQDYVYLVDFDSRLPLGWHDGAAGHRIMAGVSLCDAGDVPVHFGEEQAETMDRIGAALATLPGVASLPVILGGDATSTYAAARHAALSGPLSVVRIAAHPAGVVPDDELVCVENLDRQLARLGGVRRVQTLQGLPARGALPSGNVFLALDLGALDLAVPRQGRGLTIDETDALVAAVAVSGRLVGMNVTGLDMDRPEAPLAAVAACHVILRAMHRAVASRRRA